MNNYAVGRGACRLPLNTSVSMQHGRLPATVNNEALLFLLVDVGRWRATFAGSKA